MDIKRFSGLNNVTDPLRTGLGWLSVADNINVTDSGSIEKRQGYSKVRDGTFSGVYSAIDFQRMYTVEGGTLKSAEGVTLKTGLSSAPMFWTEVNEQVYFNNGVDSGVILPDNSVLDWRWETPPAPKVTVASGQLPGGLYRVRCTRLLDDGRETGASETVDVELNDSSSLQLATVAQGTYNFYVAPANSDVFQLVYTGSGSFGYSTPVGGRELLNSFLDPLPATADVIQEWKGSIYAAQYMPAENQTVIWFSEPLGYHLFNLNSSFILVPGHVYMLAPHKDALIIGSDERIYAYDTKTLETLAVYGVVAGQHWARDGDRTIFWTTRGVCSALPFTNLTERQVSVAPGVSAGGALVLSGGQKRYVVALRQGGSAFNPHV